MANKGKTQLMLTWLATPDKVAAVDSLIESHRAFMAGTHHREGDKALISYNFSKGPELTNPLDPGSEPTGNTRYVLNEIYESPAGIADHWQKALASWSDLPKLVEVVSTCNPQMLHAGEIEVSLW